MTLKMLALLAVGLSLVGCGEPRIDASTKEKLKESSASVRESVSDERRAEFDEAMKILAFSQVDMKDLTASGATGGANLEDKLRESLEGKSASEIIAAGAKIKGERAERERQQALKEIVELEKKVQESADAKESLKAFEVVSSRFELKEERYMGKRPIIELKVRNGTPHAVARAYFEGTIASPGRAVPWLKDSFNYSISGGLEPGEESEWSLAPNMFSDWGKVNAPSDAIFTATVTRLDGSDGTSLYGGEELSERQLKRLAELKSKFGG